MIKIEDETGEFIYSNYGGFHAICFRGDPEFLNRSRNLIYNFSPRRIKIQKHDIDTIYIIIDTDEFADILARYYRGQIIITREIPPKILDDAREIWNDKKIEEMAMSRARDFIDKIRHENILSEPRIKHYYEYRVQAQ